MKFLNSSRLPLAALLISAGLICGAWFFQYVLGYAPCQMCYWQRHAHKAVIVLSLLALAMNYMNVGRPKFWASLICVGFVVSFGLAFWHVGVEYTWWDGPKTCMTGTPQVGGYSGQDLLNSLSRPVKLPGCAEAAWRFAGISMAGWNAAASLFGALLTFAALRKESHVKNS